MIRLSFLRWLVALALFGALAGCRPSDGADLLPPGSDIRQIRDVAYGHAGGHDLKLDWYLPTKTPAPARGWPAVIYFHGGGWRVGSKDEGAKFALPLTRAGFALASIDYRLSNEAIFPAQIQDAKASVRWVHANAARFGADATRLGVIGASAGGHLVALLAVSPGVADIDDRSEGSPAASEQVQAVCDVSGPIDLSFATYSLIGNFSVWGELGGFASHHPDLVRRADPTTYIHGGEPPFLIIQGARDRLVTGEHAQKLTAALRSHGDDVTLDIVPDGGHVPLAGAAQQQEIIAFFRRTLDRP